MARFYNPVADGSEGIPGPTGPQGATGPAPWTLIGAYDNGADYTYGDAVTYQGGFYYRTGNPNNPGYPPTPGSINASWTPVADRGEQGIQGETGAVGGFGYHGSFFDEIDQTCTINSIQAMRMRTTDISNGVSVTGTNHTEIRMANAGKYNIAFSAQMHQTNSSSIANIWLAKNGTAMAWTNTKVSITANNPYYVAAWNFFVDANANDYYEIIWSSDNANCVLEAEPANAHPAIPSVIVTVNQVG